MLYALRLLTGFLPVAYALVFFLYFRLLFVEEEPRRSSFASQALALTAGLHLGALLLRGFLLNHCPLATGWEIISFLALALVGTHLIVERITGYMSPGVPVVGLAVVLQTISSSLLRYDVVVSPTLRQWEVPLHAVFGICGHAGFFTAACYSLLYLVLHRLIKQRRLDQVWATLPPLETMYRMSRWAVLCGLVFMSLAIGSGLAQAASRGLVPKPIFSSGISWVAFSGLLLVSRLRRVTGHGFTWAALLSAMLDLALLFTTETLHHDHFL